MKMLRRTLYINIRGRNTQKRQGRESDHTSRHLEREGTTHERETKRSDDTQLTGRHRGDLRNVPVLQVGVAVGFTITVIGIRSCHNSGGVYATLRRAAVAYAAPLLSDTIRADALFNGGF